MKKIIFLFLLILLFRPVSAELFKWTDANGKVYYSDQKPEGQEAKPLNLEINTYRNVTFDEIEFDAGSKKVVMYSTEWCGYCKKAARYFKKNNIAFTEYDIEKNKMAKKKYDRMKATGVPVIIVGKRRMNGFSVSGFRKLYDPRQ